MASSSTKAPEFFTVFLPEFCSHQLKITSAFKAHLEKEVTGEAIIERSDTNDIWKVDLVMEGEDFIFKNGWKEFVSDNGVTIGVSDNGVTIGEFMVFQYHGNSRFTVDFFGTDGLEKLASGKPTLVFLDENSEDDVNDDVNDDDEDYDVVDDTAKAVGGMKIGENGRGCMSPNPFSFRVCMNKNYLAKNFMHLPIAFTDQYIKGKGVQRLELRTPEKTWSVDVLSYHASSNRKLYYMFKGEAFAEFLHHNRVEAGNVCVFAALDIPCTTLSVSILRTT